MDDTHISRTSDAAAATRKRRSSILKSQRAPRTPFSELEFNVATPTDTAKSRRVSFSRRTGVAEFITNEATTTWKNFYEEHNKSLESSGNESGANAPRPIGHIGKRIFDQQFQEVEAIDFGSTLDNRPNRNLNTSINNVNFTQQLASLECTGDDKKLTIPQQNFEMSAFTDHQSNLFGDDLAIPTIGEMSGHIDVNFSAVQTIGQVKDDLDEIQDDIQRVQNNMVCPGPFTGRRSLSEYIEVDLNATNMVIKNDDDDDMSITDTIQSPKVQDVSKNHSSVQIDKNSGSSKDWMADKENIVLNPYVAPKESTNFAVHDESDKILVFDGKRLTIQSDKEADKILKGNCSDLRPTVPKETKSHQRNIVLNVNDDLPNFIEDPHMLSSNGILGSASFKHSFMYDNNDDLTNDKASLEKQKTIQGNDTGNISITQAIPNNIFLGENVINNPEKTVVFDDIEADISMTQVHSSKIISHQVSKVEPQRRRTILYENDTGDISITQAIPANILLNENQQKDEQKSQPERRRTILYDNDMGNISMTQAIPANIILNLNKEYIETESERRRTIVFENDMSNISMTQAIPTNIILNEKKEGKKLEPERRRTILYDNEIGNISITQAIPANIILNERKEGESNTEPDRRKTILYDNDVGNVSMTQAIPSNILVNKNRDVNTNKTVHYDNVEADISMTQAIPTNLIFNSTNLNPDSIKRKTIVFDCEDGDISVTKALPSKIIITEEKYKSERKSYQPKIFKKIEMDNEKSRTMVYDDIAGNISITQTVPNKVIILAEDDLEDKINIVASATDVGDVSVTGTVPTNMILSNEKRKTIVHEDEVSNNSVKGGGILTTSNAPLGLASFNEKRKQILYENADDIFLTENQPENIFRKENDGTISCLSSSVPSNITLGRKESETTVKDKDGNISVDTILPTKKFRLEKSEVLDKQKTNKYENNTPVAQPVLVNVLIVNNATEKRRSIVYNTEAESALAEKSKVTTIQENIDSEPKNVSEVRKKFEPEKEILSDCSPLKKESEDDVLGNISLISTQPKNVILEDKPELKDNHDSSSDNLIYIIRDVEDETQTDRRSTCLTWKDDVLQIQHSPLSLEYKENVDAEATADLQRTLNELKCLVHEKKTAMNSNLKNIISTDLESEKLLDVSESQDRSLTSKVKSFKTANDTNELLEMLSDLTERKPVEKIEQQEPKRLSVLPNRLSIVISREDLMNNISMAQAALQKSLEIDESIDDTVLDTPDEFSAPSKKAVRVSKEVVKKLQFEEDESASDASIKTDMKGSPLKKTALGQTEYMKDCKANVIPSYLSDVSNEIKALMNDLVKPNADTTTYQTPQTDTSLKKMPSTSSTQIQANLITSSQIDLDTERISLTDSGTELEKEPSGLSMNKLEELPKRSFHLKQETRSPSQDRVIVFDHNNPLNNILLVPLDFSEVHRYNPHKSNESQSTDSQSTNSPQNNEQVVGSVLVQHTMLPSGDSTQDKYDSQSLRSNISKPMSVDESVSARMCEFKDTEVNTVIAMKENKDLLKTSSSLTLVDDALAQSAFDLDLETVTADNKSSTTNAQDKSPVKVIYHNEEKDAILSDRVSYFTSTDDISEPVVISTKGKKRIYSSTKKDKQRQSVLSSLDITPKQMTKMQKLSNSPKYKDKNAKDEVPEKLPAEKDENVKSKSSMEVDDSSDATDTATERKRTPRKSKSSKSKKPGTAVTVQQLLTEYSVYTNLDQDALSKQIIDALSRSDSSTAPTSVSLTDIESKSPDVVSSFTSSKNQNEMQEALSVLTTVSQTLTNQSRSGKMEWQPEAVKDSSCSQVFECESSVNVVAKIDMLPFMGSHECEWEASGIDTWSFRLLHGRLRLTVRLAHRHDNATRTRVRADTPVLHAALETAHADKKNSVASLCVGFALETMRYFIGRGCSKAGSLPSLLRRCAGVARVALRWGRAMHEARLHLAYTLANDGCLALKVANIPLRSVWEVTMRIELVVEDAREVPWPRACDVRVSRVVSDVQVTDEEVRRVLATLPRDWGHAPRAVWKIFRYLKNKTRMDDLLGV